MESELAPLRIDPPEDEKPLESGQVNDFKTFEKPDEDLRRRASIRFDPDDMPLSRPRQIHNLNPNAALGNVKSFIEDLDYEDGIVGDELADSPTKVHSDQATDPYSALVTQINLLQIEHYPKDRVVAMDSRGIDENIIIQPLPKSLLVHGPSLTAGPKKNYRISPVGSILLVWDQQAIKTILINWFLKFVIVRAITLTKCLEFGKPSNMSTTLKIHTLLEACYAWIKNRLNAEEKQAEPATNPEQEGEQKPSQPRKIVNNYYYICGETASSKIEEALSKGLTPKSLAVYDVLFSKDSTCLIVITSIMAVIVSLKDLQVSYMYLHWYNHFPNQKLPLDWLKHSSELAREFAGASNMASTVTDDIFYKVENLVFKFNYQIRKPLWFGEISTIILSANDTDSKKKEKQVSGSLKFQIVLTPTSQVEVWESKTQTYEHSEAQWLTTFVYVETELAESDQAQSLMNAKVLRSAHVEKKNIIIGCIESRELGENERKCFAFEEQSQQIVRLSLGDSKRFEMETVTLNLQHLSPQDLPAPSELRSSSDLQYLFVDYGREHWKIFIQRNKLCGWIHQEELGTVGVRRVDLFHFHHLGTQEPRLA